MPENFSFFLLEDGKPQFYRLRRDFIDLGGDYTLYNHHNKDIGTLDGKVFSIGGKWTGRVKREHADPRLLIVLKLFCGMLIFNADAAAICARWPATSPPASTRPSSRSRKPTST